MNDVENSFKEIQELFLFLTEQKENLPTPDDEMEAREKLIESFKNLKSSGKNIKLSGLMDIIIDNLENWDTLDLWFKEVKDLSQNIQKFINIIETETDQEEIFEEIVEKIEPKEIETKTESVKIDISQIVAQVTEKFEGEIGSLKEKIESLQKKLKNKDKTLENLSNKGKIQKITPIKGSKLPTPKIKIPVLKKPQKIPQLKIKARSEDKRLDVKKSDSYSVKKEIEKLKHSLETIKKSKLEGKPSSFTSLEPDDQFYTKIDINEPQINIEGSPAPSPPSIPATPENIGDDSIQDKQELINKNIETHPTQKLAEVSPPPAGATSFQEGAGDDSVETSEVSTKDSRVSNEPVTDQIITEEPPIEIEQLEKSENILSDLPEKPRIMPVVTESPSRVSDLLEKPRIIPVVTEEPSRVSDLFEKPKIMPVVTEEPFKKPVPSKESKEVPFIAEKPKITAINVEKSEIGSIKSSATDLFNVFSSVGDKAVQQPAETHESLDMIIAKSTKMRKEKSKKRGVDFDQKITFTPFGFNTTEPSDDDISSINIEDLPRDKDSLYQELIALEGKRYSLERSFKALETSYQEGTINDQEYKSRSNKLKGRLVEISLKINEIRKLISSL